MNLPTIEELEALFREHWDKDANAKRDIQPVFQLAKKSELIKGCAGGAMMAMIQGITPLGMSPEPVLIFILMGMRMGVIWANGGKDVEWKAPEPTKEELANKAYLEWLEKNPGTEEGKD